MVQGTWDEEHDEIRVRAREALQSYGRFASKIVSQEAEAQFLLGNVLGAFYQRLIVRAIEQLEEELRQP
jgi:hypothetical protein